MGLIKWLDMKLRRAHVRRVTNETRIALNLNLDGKGQASVKTGIPFFDHMLTLFAKHAVVNLRLRCQGDLAVDAHHTVEDCGLALGQAFAHCVIDFSGRPCLIWRGLDDFAYKSLSKAQKSQDLSTAFRFGLAREFFQGFANQARCTLHLELLYGDEPHHIVEALFKAFAKAVDVACQQDARIAGRLPTTKGKL